MKECLACCSICNTLCILQNGSPMLTIYYYMHVCLFKVSDINIFTCIINQIWILTSYQIWIFYPCTYGHSVFIIINNNMVFQNANPSRILKVVFNTDNLKCYAIKKVQKCVFQSTSTILTYLNLF
eukprot:73312_1